MYDICAIKRNVSRVSFEGWNIINTKGALIGGPLHVSIVILRNVIMHGIS